MKLILKLGVLVLLGTSMVHGRPSRGDGPGRRPNAPNSSSRPNPGMMGKVENYRKGQRDHTMASFSTWCSDNWDQKRACMVATREITDVTELLRDATVEDPTTGEYSVDVATALAFSSAPVLVTNMDGTVLFDGTRTDFINVKEEDPEFWKTIKRPGFSYMLADAEADELLAFNRVVLVRPAKAAEEEEEDEFGDSIEPEDEFDFAGAIARRAGGRGGKLDRFDDEDFEKPNRPIALLISTPVVIEEGLK